MKNNTENQTGRSGQSPRRDLIDLADTDLKEFDPGLRNPEPQQHSTHSEDKVKCLLEHFVLLNIKLDQVIYFLQSLLL